jgi:phage-related minor tail protein
MYVCLADKLAAKKQHEREVHDRLKQAQRDKKEEGKGKKLEAKALLKEERVLHDTKRAHTDMRHQKHRAEHKETGQMCEHGVVRAPGGVVCVCVCVCVQGAVVPVTAHLQVA